MKIYKLNDEVSESVTNFDAEKDVAFLKVTDIRQGMKNENRVNVFVNGKFSFSLDIAQLVDLKLKVGENISEEKLEECKKASEFGKLYQRTLEWVLTRPRSEKETYDYLYKKIYEKKLEKDYIGEIVKKLKEKKYLDDEMFARYFVENRFVKKGVSAKRLRMELTKKGVAREIIDRIVDGSERNDEDEIRKIIVRKRARYDDEKLAQYLCRQGFDFELVRRLLNES